MMRDTLQIIRDFISTRRTNYIRTFLNPPGEEVLKDLARFCKANESCFQADPRAHAVAEGRREVWLRIQKNLNLTDEQLWALYTPVNLQPTDRG